MLAEGQVGLAGGSWYKVTFRVGVQTPGRSFACWQKGVNLEEDLQIREERKKEGIPAPENVWDAQNRSRPKPVERILYHDCER